MEWIIPNEEQDKIDRIQKRKDELSIDNALIRLKKEKTPQVFWNPNTNKMEVLPYNESVAKKLAWMWSDFVKWSINWLEHSVKWTATWVTWLLSLAETLWAFALDSTWVTDLLWMDSLLDREWWTRKWNKDLTSHRGRDEEWNYKNEWIEPVVSWKSVQEAGVWDFREMNQFLWLPIPWGLLWKLKVLQKIKITNPKQAWKVDDVFNAMVKLEKDYANKINKINSITDKKEAAKALKELNKNRDKAFAQLEKNLSSKTDEIKKAEEATSKVNEAASKISNTKIDDIITQIDDINKSYKWAWSVLEYNKKILDITKKYPHLKNDILELAKVEEWWKIIDIIWEPVKKIINNLWSTTTSKILDNIKEASTWVYKSVKDKTWNALDYIATKYPKTTWVLWWTKDVIKTVKDNSSVTWNLWWKLNTWETDEEIKNRILWNNNIESIIPDDEPTTNIASSTTTQPVQNTQQPKWSKLWRQFVYDDKKNVIWFVSALKDKDWKNIIRMANWVDDANKLIKEWVIWHNAKLYNSLSWEETTDWVKQITKQQTDLRNRLIKDWFTEKELNEKWIY